MISSQIAAAFIEDEKPEIRRKGLKILAGSSSGIAEKLLVKALYDPSDHVWPMAVDVLRMRQPWLSLKVFNTRPVPLKAIESSPGKSWQNLRNAIHKHLVDSSCGSDLRYLERWLLLPGAIPDITEELMSLGKNKVANHIAAKANLFGNFDEEFRPILFAPTYECNLNCTYCYVKKWNLQFNGGISEEDLGTVFSWCADQGVNFMVLAGGEPTIYRYFSKLLSLAQQNRIRVLLTSNMLYSKSNQQLIHPGHIQELIAHYDQGLMQDERKSKAFEDNLSAARSSDVDIFLRYTLTEESNAEEWEHIINLATKYGIESLHYAFAFKNLLRNNASVEFIPSARRSVFEVLFNEFVTSCRNEGLKLHLCKPIPFCAVSESTLKELLLNETLRSACGAPYRNCTQNLTINPDLSTSPCNALCLKGPKITELSNLNDASVHYKALLKHLLFYPYFEKCNECMFFFRGFCQGVCLAEKYSTTAVKETKHVFTRLNPEL